MLSYLKDKLTLNIPDKSAKLCLIGSCLQRFGTGGVSLWGVLSVYYYSYFRETEKELKFTKLTLYMNLAIIPLLFGMLFSVKLAEKVGTERLIMWSSCLYSAFIMLSVAYENLIFFLILYVGLSITAEAVSNIPVLTSLWSHFKNDTGKVTGILFFVQCISQLSFSYIAMAMVNPHNVKGQDYKESGMDETIQIYGSDIANRVKWATAALGGIYAVFNIPGSYMITEKKDKTPEKETKDIELETKKSTENEISVIQQKHTDNQLEKSMITTERSEDSKDKEIIVKSDGEMGQCRTIKQGAFSQVFVIIAVCTFLCSVLYIYLQMNLKVYALTKINDDAYITTVSNMNVLAQAIFSFIWGYLIETYNFRELNIIQMSGFFIFGVTFVLALKVRALFMIWYIFIGIMTAGYSAVGGPALLKIFGPKIGKQLYPIKSAVNSLAYLMYPLLNLLAINYIGLDTLMYIIGGICAIAVLIAFKIRRQYSW